MGVDEMGSHRLNVTHSFFSRIVLTMRDQTDSSEVTNKLRPLNCELGSLTRPDGSAVLSQGDTCIISAVYGPGEVRMNREQLDKATVEVVYKPKSGLPGCVDKSRERILRNTCETVLIASLHPRSSINITVQELQDSGSFLATCLNSACLALLDASVSMKCLVGAVHCCINDNGEIILDPTCKEEADSVANMTFAFDSRDKNVITVVANGKFSKDQFEKCLVTCREASSAVFAFFKESVEKKMSKSV